MHLPESATVTNHIGLASLIIKNAIEANLPIGSGELESVHPYLRQKRLKHAGAWWEATNAENIMLALRVLQENGGWENYRGEHTKQAA